LLLSSSRTLDKGPKIFFNATLLSSCNLSGSNVILRCVSSATQLIQVHRLNVLLKFKTLKAQQYQFYFIYGLFNDALRSTDCRVSNGGAGKEVIMAKFMVLPWQKPRGTKETHRTKNLSWDSWIWGPNLNSGPPG
jgi:hypothetical protein